MRYAILDLAWKRPDRKNRIGKKGAAGMSSRLSGCGAADQSGGIHGPFRNILSREHLHEQGNRRGAQKFHPIVRRGDLRRAADGKEGIVVACDLKLLRDLPSGVKGVFDSAGCQFVVRGKAGVKGYASVLQELSPGFRKGRGRNGPVPGCRVRRGNEGNRQASASRCN